jgi:DNA invertase Pin-like site-specific DNA recombinase
MVGIYCRISGNKEEGKDTSIETQEEMGVIFANSIGEAHQFYYDIGISGAADIEERDDFNKFIKDINNGNINHVYAIHQNRIERSPDTWRLFVASVVNSGCKWYPNGIFYDLDDTTNRALASLLSIINEMHSDLTSDAVKRAFRKNALKGKGHGIRAYGITYDDNGFMEHEPEEIETVKDIFKWSLEGIGAYTIANKLNTKGIPTRYKKLGLTPIRKEKNTGKSYKNSSKKWWGSTISGILKKEIYKGVHVWGDERISLPHLAILTEEEFDKVQKNFKINKKERSGKTTTYKYLLNGLVFCNECGSMYRGVRKVKSRDNSYKCKGKAAPTHICKKSRGVNIPKIETFIIKHLFLSKQLQQHLNSIEVDNSEIDELKIKKKQFIKKIKSQEKIVTRDYNLMRDPDLIYDTRLKDDYQGSKMKLSKMKDDLIFIEDRLKEQLFNNRLNRVNNVIDGFDISAGFIAIKQAVQRLIERVDISYKPLKKNGLFHFIIKYKGFNERSIWTTNQQLNKFTLLGYQPATELIKDEVQDFIIPEYLQQYMGNNPNKDFFKDLVFQLKTTKPLQEEFLITGIFDVIKLDKKDLVNFN